VRVGWFRFGRAHRAGRGGHFEFSTKFIFALKHVLAHFKQL